MSVINIKLTDTPDPAPSGRRGIYINLAGQGRMVDSAGNTYAIAGTNGWSPIFALVTDGERRVLQLVDWTGGEGAKPSTGQYIGPAGLVATTAEAVDLRGTGGREVELRVDGTNLQWRYVGDVSWITLIDLSTIGGSGGVQSVTGDGVDNTDPANPVISQYPEASTSTTIDFTKPKTFGSFGSPITGAITESNTNAKRVVQVIFYSGASFTAPHSSWEPSRNSEYDPAVVNIIYVEYFSDTYKRYWFDQDV